MKRRTFESLGSPRFPLTVYWATRTNYQDAPAETEPVKMILFSDFLKYEKAVKAGVTRLMNKTAAQSLGKLGGQARAKKLTKAQRLASSRKANEAKQAKRNK